MKEINETGKLQYYKPKKKMWIYFLVADVVLVAVIVAKLRG